MDEELVEKVARRIYETRNGHGCKAWVMQPKAHKEPYQSDARAAIQAMMNAGARFPGDDKPGRGYAGGRTVLHGSGAAFKDGGAGTPGIMSNEVGAGGAGPK